jgi:hypothetical protein
MSGQVESEFQEVANPVTDLDEGIGVNVSCLVHHSLARDSPDLLGHGPTSSSQGATIDENMIWPAAINTGDRYHDRQCVNGDQVVVAGDNESWSTPGLLSSYGNLRLNPDELTRREIRHASIFSHAVTSSR